MVASMGARYGVGLVDHPKTQNRVGHVLRLPRRFLGARSIRGGADDGGNAVIAFGNARQGVMICLAGLAAEIACLNRCDADGADGDEELIRKFQVEENMSDERVELLGRMVFRWAQSNKREILQLARKIDGAGRWKLT